MEFYRQGGDTGQKWSFASEKLARLKESATKPGASPRAKYEYANGLMTADPPELRDFKEALKFALEANELAGSKSGYLLDSLAIAYHLAGQKKQAIETEKKALSLVSKNEVWARQIDEEHLVIFQGGGRPDESLVHVLQGKWSGHIGPMNVKVEFRPEGQYIVGVNLNDLPWIVPANVTLYRLQVDTGRLELQVADSGWKNPHFVPLDHLLTDKGDLILWSPLDWDPVRLHRD